MGGEFVGSPECGCVRGKIELKMTSSWTGVAEGASTTEQVTATVPLTADSSGLVFTGSAPLVHGWYTVTTPPECRVERRIRRRAAAHRAQGGHPPGVAARIDGDGKDDIRVLVAGTSVPTGVGGTCAGLDSMKVAFKIVCDTLQSNILVGEP